MKNNRFPDFTAPAASKSAAEELLRAPGFPLHRQMFLSLRDLIFRSRWPAGHPLPTEAALCAEYGVSRATVRRALSDLAGQGLVERRHGLGTFVLQGAVSGRRGMNLSYLDELQKVAAETQVQVLRVERSVPSADIAAELKLGENEQAVHAARLRLRNTDAKPLMLIEAWVPARLGAKITPALLRKKPLYEILLAQGVEFGRVIQEITAEAADPPRARLLRTEVGAAMLKVTRVIHDLGDQPIEYVEARMPADSGRILMEIPAEHINTLSAGRFAPDA